MLGAIRGRIVAKGANMARKRGFFAELNHQAQQAAKRREQAERQAARTQAAALRKAEQAVRQAERAQEAARRAAAAEAKQAEREAQHAYVEAREAEVSAKNADLAVVYEEIDGILASTLGVDDYVDLETLRQVAVHPPFEPGQLAVPTLPPPRLVPPPAPEFVPPPGEPKGLGRVLGGTKKYLRRHRPRTKPSCASGRRPSRRSLRGRRNSTTHTRRPRLIVKRNSLLRTRRTGRSAGSERPRRPSRTAGSTS